MKTPKLSKGVRKLKILQKSAINFENYQNDSFNNSCSDTVETKLSPKEINFPKIKKVTVEMSEVNHYSNRLSPSSAFHIKLSENSFVAKQLVYRRSWSGYPFDDLSINDFGQLSLKNRSHAPLKMSHSSPATSTQRKSSFRKKKVSTTKIPKSFTENQVNSCMFQRRLPSFRRMHRNGNAGQSTIRRRVLRTRTMEIGIAKTLFTVVLTITMTTFPFIGMTVYRIGRDDWSNSETTWFVVTMTILISNSLWNSIIYGARMPYFRQMIKRTWCRYFNEVRCCSKIMRSNVRRKIENCVEIQK